MIVVMVVMVVVIERRVEAISSISGERTNRMTEVDRVTKISQRIPPKSTDKRIRPDKQRKNNSQLQNHTHHHSLPTTSLSLLTRTHGA